MRNTKGDWQDDSATWFACLADRRDFFLPGFGPVTLEKGDVAVLFANTWHAGMAEQAGADGADAVIGEDTYLILLDRHLTLCEECSSASECLSALGKS